MANRTRIQLIERKNSRQFYISFPSALEQSMEFKKGEEVELTVKDKGTP